MITAAAPFLRMRALACVGALLLAACGDYGAPPETALTDTDPGPAKNCDDLFSTRVQTPLGFCRNCHVPNGVAAVPDGEKFLLSPLVNGALPADDYEKLRTSWEALGKNGDGPSRILKMASGTDTRSHTGGMPWPVDSNRYKDMDALLKGFEDPAACVASDGTPPVEWPLLGSKHARHLWASYCDSKEDTAELPADPRSLVRPGANASKAVFYNAWWEDCHVNAPETEQQPRTCGEFRTRRDNGLKFLLDELPSGSTTAASYNDTWKKWGLAERPDTFDELYTLRYGLNHAPFANPYPLPGENPNDPDHPGGTGQLPLGLRQGRNADGTWTGTIGSAACFACHGGQIGDPAAGDPELIAAGNLGLGNNNYDVPMSARDASPFNGTPLSDAIPGLTVESLFNIGIRQRGQNNAVGAFEVLVSILDLDSLGLNPNPYKSIIYGAAGTGVQDAPHPMAHTQDTPAWWNMGSRPRKFFDAGVSNDSTRIIMAAGDLAAIAGPGVFDGKAYRTSIELHDQDLEAYFLSLQSPVWPEEELGAIDVPLAEQGAILFHTKNLFAGVTDATKKPAGGNGSCAGCHGAYSPHFVHDTAYLETSALEGVAGHIALLDVIGTDRARSDMLTPTLRAGWATSYWGYPEGFDRYVSPDEKDPLTEKADDQFAPLRPAGGACAWEQEVIGYQAPPLYGVWATAPYFHNGSVPTVEAVLDSAKRSPIWRRQLETRADGLVTGFDQSLAAYDASALGWKHADLACADMPGDKNLNCSPAGDQGPSLIQIVQNLIDGFGWTGVAPIPDPAEGSFDKRLVYDTRILGNGNTGHEFSDVLIDIERRAVVEYLKTL